MTFLVLNDTELHYEVGGNGKRLILIHCAGATMRLWDPQWEAFTRSHRVLRYDLRAHGQSSAWQPNIPFYAADDLLALMNTADLERATLVASGYGTKVAVDLALDTPGRVAGLMLLSPRTPAWGAPSWIRVGASVFNTIFGDGLSDGSPPDPRTYERLAAARRDHDVEALADILSQSTFNGPSPDFPDARETARRMLIENGRYLVPPEGTELWHVVRPRSGLKKLQMPCLPIIAGAEPALLQKVQHKFASTTNSEQALVQPSNTQWMSLEEPERFTSIVLDWLAAHDL